MGTSLLHRTVTIVARGKIKPEEIFGMAMKLVAEKVRSFGKILEVASATTEFTLEQIVRLGEMMRGGSTEKRGPIPFVVDTDHIAFPQAVAMRTEQEGPIKIFTSLREARRWTEHLPHGPRPSRRSYLMHSRRRLPVDRRLARRRGPIRNVRGCCCAVPVSAK